MTYDSVYWDGNEFTWAGRKWLAQRLRDYFIDKNHGEKVCLAGRSFVGVIRLVSFTRNRYEVVIEDTEEVMLSDLESVLRFLWRRVSSSDTAWGEES